MIESNIDLAELARELSNKADSLAAAAVVARADADAAATKSAAGDALDPLFADKLDISLAPSLHRLQEMAKRSK